MGLLDHPGVFHIADPFDNQARRQYVTLSYCALVNHTDPSLLVAANGMGQDIWTVPFDNITKMFKVCMHPRAVKRTCSRTQ